MDSVRLFSGFWTSACLRLSSDSRVRYDLGKNFLKEIVLACDYRQFRPMKILESNLLDLLSLFPTKGPFTRCNLYNAVPLYHYAEIKEMIYESENLEGVIYD